jgi:hypothetical protein
MERVLLLSANTYAFKEEGTDRDVEGVSFFYVPADSPAEDVVHRGVSVLKMSTSRKELWQSCTVLPGVYELDIQMRPGRGMKPTPTLTGLRYVKSVNIAEIIDGEIPGKGSGRTQAAHSNTA